MEIFQTHNCHYTNYIWSGYHKKVGTLGDSSSLGRSVWQRPRSPHLYLLLLSDQRPRIHLPGHVGRCLGHQGLQLRHGLHEEGKIG